MIYVIATVQLHPNTRERYLRAVEAVSSEIRREDGCIEYRAAVDVESGLARQSAVRPDVVIIMERWRDLAALTAHSTAAHMQAFRQGVTDLVVSTSLQVLAPAERGG